MRSLPVHRAQLAAERKLAGELVRGQPLGVDLSGGGEDAEGDRQVEAARFLRQVGRREVDRHALVVRKLEPARLQGGADALARLLHFGLGEADQCEARQAVGQMDFDRDLGRLEPAQGPAVNGGEAHGEGERNGRATKVEEARHCERRDRRHPRGRPGTKRHQHSAAPAESGALAWCFGPDLDA